MNKFERLSFKLDTLHGLRFFYSQRVRKALELGHSKGEASLRYKVADIDQQIAEIEAAMVKETPAKPRRITRRIAGTTVH
jgi:predicted P-loop ATPase/GTPase